MRFTSIEQIMGQVKVRNLGEREFCQAVREVVAAVLPVVEANPAYRQAKILERIVEPERVIMFRVPWLDDLGNVQVNRGFRVEMNSAIGPFQGGLRFHPSVNLSIMKFLAFEQVFQNALTGLPLGGAKGGADFDPKGKSELEIMRFCQSFMTELYRYLGTESDIAMRGVGVRSREIGYLFGAYKKLSRQCSGGAIAGKGVNWGGSLLRTEAGGYGAIYFLERMMHNLKHEIGGLRICISGAGGAALNAAVKAVQMGTTVLTLSDTQGLLFAPQGFTLEQLQAVRALKKAGLGSLEVATEDYPELTFSPGETPWHIPCDVAMPAATQNELYGEDAEQLINGGVIAVVEAADMPCTPDAVTAFQEAGVALAPSKAVNAGTVIVAGLETAQNASHQAWDSAQVEMELRRIMNDIHESCLRYGTDADGRVDYIKGANVAAFVRVADAMLDQGIV